MTRRSPARRGRRGPAVLAAAVLVLTAAAPGLTAAASTAAAPAPAAAEAPHGWWWRVQLTGYTWQDNTPPGGAISHPVLRDTAGGTGTWDDPLTLAVGHTITDGRDVLDWPPGLRVYIPSLARYAVVEDTCGDGAQPQDGPCHDLARAPAGAQAWIDVWVGGQDATAEQSAACASAITGLTDVIAGAPPGWPVTPGPITAPDGTCALPSTPTTSATTAPTSNPSSSPSGSSGPSSSSSGATSTSSPTAASPTGAPFTPSRASSSWTTPGGVSLNYHLWAAPDQPLTHVLVYLDGDDMEIVDRPDDGYLARLAEQAAARGYATLAPRTPSSDGTWRSDGQTNAAAVRDLLAHLAPTATDVRWIGYSGGSQLITKYLLPGYGANVPAGGALVLGGGGAPGRAPGLPAGWPITWITGTSDTGDRAPDGYDAITDARAGAEAYRAAGAAVTLTTPDGLDHGAVLAQLDQALPALLNSAAPSTAPAQQPPQQQQPAPQQPAPQQPAPQGPASQGPARTLQGDLTSAHWPGHRAHWIAAVPAGTPRATVIVLHGRGDNAATAADGLDLTSHAARTNLALVAIDGESTYWTDDGAGTDTGAMVIEDLLPQLAAQGLPVERVAVTGYSMGGLGALLLAQRWPQRIIAAAPMSAAVWAQPHPGIEGTAQTAVRRDVARLANTPVRIVSGTEDDLTPDNQSLAALIPHAATAWTPGGHDFSYWAPALTGQLDWITSQLP